MLPIFKEQGSDLCMWVAQNYCRDHTDHNYCNNVDCNAVFSKPVSVWIFGFDAVNRFSVNTRFAHDLSPVRGEVRGL